MDDLETDREAQCVLRIGGTLYDLTDWLDHHPGGRELLELQSRHFADATYAFEAHHSNQSVARELLERFRIGSDDHLSPQLSRDQSFYSEFRRRVARYLKSVQGGGPTLQGWIVWWVSISGFFLSHILALLTGSYWSVLPLAMFAGLVGAYGHNWVHQPRYRGFALCLDLIGLSCRQWQTSHVLQHHMFTNTPHDNHWGGTSPFMVVDPVRPRNKLQKSLCWLYFIPVVFCGLFANFVLSLKELFSDRRAWRGQLFATRLILPATFLMYSLCWGWRGVLILIAAYGLTSTWYFTLALTNHNNEASWDVDKRRKAEDWGEAQLLASSDVGPQCSYIASAMYLWLNYHTVHHLMPSVDQSHYPRIQQILVEVCAEFGVKYTRHGFWRMLAESMRTFQTARMQGVKLDWSKIWSPDFDTHYSLVPDQRSKREQTIQETD
ncbi:MAG: hypothetical protein GY948_11715 [Alphaproteobacteria bacterium]|nr:hypothetical protein [Alphaproteobacteria bacterium]